MILRSLGYREETLDDYAQPAPLDPCELKAATRILPVCDQAAEGTHVTVV